MSEETLIIILLCFILGLLLRGELEKLRRKKHE